MLKSDELFLAVTQQLKHAPPREVTRLYVRLSELAALCLLRVMEFGSRGEVDMEDDGLSVPEVARRLGCSASAVYEMIAANKIESYRVGAGRRGVRVVSSAVRRYQRQREGYFRLSRSERAKETGP